MNRESKSGHPCRLPLNIVALSAALLLAMIASVGGAQAPADSAGTVTTYELLQSQVPLGEAGVNVERTADGYRSSSYVRLDGLLDFSNELVTHVDGTAVSYSLEGSAQGAEVSVAATFSATGVVLDIVQAGTESTFDLAVDEPLYVIDNNFVDGYQILINAMLESGSEHLEGAVLVPQAATLGHMDLRATEESAYIVTDDERIWATRFDITITARNQVIELGLWVDEASEIALLEQTIGAIRFERRSDVNVAAAAAAAAVDAAAAAAASDPAMDGARAALETAAEFLTRTAECVDVTKVQVTSTGETLQGLLSLPRNAGNSVGAPTLVLLPGSGAVDLRGNSLPVITHAGYEQLANALGCHGFGVLRVAKLGIAPSTGDANAVTLGTYASNTADWLAQLATMPGVDARRLGVMGHSEGGLIALYATATGVIEPAAVVLLATAGRPLDVVLREQLLSTGRRGGADDAALEQLGEQVDEVIQAVKGSSGTTLELEGKLAANPVAQLFAHAAGLLRSEFEADPAALIAVVDAPTVIFQGAKDLQVLPADGEILATAAPTALYLELPNMSHNLVDISGPAITGLIPSSDAVVSRTLVGALATFLNGSLRLH